MALITKRHAVNGHYYTHTYSDAGFYIRSDDTGELYVEAYDPVGSGRTYTETDVLIEDEETEDVENVESGVIQDA